MNRFVILAWFLISGFWVVAQSGEFRHARPLTGISDTWHSITLPPELFGEVNHDLSDIRILGINEEGDTVEAPYILETSKESSAHETVEFQLLNSSSQADIYFYTFGVPSLTPISRIDLTFDEKNFDWLLRLEGSQDLEEWYVIHDQYRIVSISNDHTNYNFSSIIFPSSSYRYFRMAINSGVSPKLKKASLTRETGEGGNHQDYSCSFKVNERRSTKETEIDIRLKQPVSVSMVELVAQDTLDYYRPIELSYAYDSIQTAEGLQLRYRTVYRGTLSSLEPAVFHFDDVTASSLRVIISNRDNQPLTIGDIRVKGHEYRLLARFNEPAVYRLVYGWKDARAPDYDIRNFRDQIPAQLEELQVGHVVAWSEPVEVLRSGPLFVNTWWLWGVMIVIIGVLGWFSLRMMRSV